MVVVELRNHTYCTQEIPVMHRGEELYVDPRSVDTPRSDHAMALGHCQGTIVQMIEGKVLA